MLLAIQKISLAGLNPAFTAATALGDEFVNSGRDYLHVINGGVNPVAVTVDSQTRCNQGFDHNVTVDVPAGGEARIGPFPQNRFNDDAGHTHVTYSDAVGVTVAVVELP